jgi:hypothetical protein
MLRLKVPDRGFAAPNLCDGGVKFDVRQMECRATVGLRSARCCVAGVPCLVEWCRSLTSAGNDRRMPRTTSAHAHSSPFMNATRSDCAGDSPQRRQPRHLAYDGAAPRKNIGTSSARFSLGSLISSRRKCVTAPCPAHGGFVPKQQQVCREVLILRV